MKRMQSQISFFRQFLCKLEIFQCMHSGTGAPHKSRGLAALGKKKEGVSSAC